MAIEPELGEIKDKRQRIVVLLPAPLGPKKPKTSPLLTVNETSFTASKSPNFLASCLTYIMGSFIKIS